MDWYPLYNSLRIAAVSSVVVFFSGIFAAYYIARLNKVAKGVLDIILTLPLVLPPTVVGYFLLLLLGARRPLGAWALGQFGVKLVAIYGKYIPEMECSLRDESSAERYLNNPADTAPEELLTEIYIPVE